MPPQKYCHSGLSLNLSVGLSIGLSLFIAIGALSLSMSAWAQNEAPPSTLRPDAQQKSAQERQAREQRQKQIKNTVDCFISERRLNPNKHTTCIYKCPNGKLESESVAPGYQCPPRMNVIQR
ncbi:MAG: hypothetical protein ACO3DD_08775 [Burkholderiaceae bacterium]